MAAPGELLEAFEREAGRTLSLWRRLTAPQLLAASFLVLIAFGTLLLLTLPGLYTGERLSFVDALFTATSAVCVTGLAVVDTGTFFTPFGQGVLLCLIQLGGLGILTFTTVVILWLGGRISLRSEELVGGFESGPPIDAARLLRGVLRYTVAIEALGALLLWLAWTGDFGPIHAIWPAIFHAISAFCNAGFSIFSGNLVRFAGRPFTLSVIMGLILLGGIGFLVLEELNLKLRGKSQRPLSLHTRLVLVTTAALVVGAAILFSFFEWTNLLRPFPLFVRPFEALFLSIVPRTAGFNTVNYGDLTSASVFLTIILMVIGGSPGSTAGGLKTTTVAVLVALAVARTRGRLITSAFRRTIPEATIQRAIGLVIFVVALLAASLLLLLVTELGARPYTAVEDRFVGLVFEIASAVGTVGLTMDVTPGLTPAGKVIISILMFIGRVGPLTVAASMIVAAERTRVRLRYATEDVIIG